MKSYEITYNKVRKEYWIWIVKQNNDAEILSIRKSKQSCEIFLMNKGILEWIDRT